MPQLLSPRATTTEARVPRVRAPQREATAMRSQHTAMKSSLLYILVYIIDYLVFISSLTEEHIIPLKEF